MKQLLFIPLFFLLSFQLLGQTTIPFDSIKFYIMENVQSTSHTGLDEYLKVYNTCAGGVLYEPSETTVWLSRDTLKEVDGFEMYSWEIQSIDTLKDGVVHIKGICPMAWGKDAYVIFIFKPLNTVPSAIHMIRELYRDEKKLWETEKVLVKRSAISQLVCLREPKPEWPGTDLPLTKPIPTQLKFATKADFDQACE